MGPGVDAFVSADTPFGGAPPSAAVVETGVGSGGGSMTDDVVDVLETGSGREGIVSSAEDVSMVTCLVTGGDWRRV